ncbi:MAG: signal peptidase I, partial [Oscillospiraceae bacterium]|nr:signal peptidase I [Oscillospiraceae bacterium]
GDLLIANRLASDYEKDDVVIYTQDGETKVGRIVAVGGDVVTLDDGGSLIVNGTVQSGDIVYLTYALDGLEYPYSVPEGSVFILGDYRTNAEDSRTFGPVAEENILGRVMTLLRRRGL